MSARNPENGNRPLPCNEERGTDEAPEGPDPPDDLSPAPAANDPPADYPPTPPSSAGEFEPHLSRGEGSLPPDLADFERLVSQFLVPLVAHAPADSEVRVWVPGCGTGEGAYTLTILLQRGLPESHRLKVFATDADRYAIEFARRGLFSGTWAEAVPVDFRGRFLSPFGRSGWRVAPAVRGAMVFATHDVLTDATITRLDLISGAQLLARLAPHYHAQVLALFRHALRGPGFLSIGAASLPADVSGGFEVLPIGQGFYRRSATRPRSLELFPILGRDRSRGRVSRPPVRTEGIGGLTASDVLTEVDLTALLVDANHKVLLELGPVSRYLNPAAADSSGDLLLRLGPAAAHTLAEGLEQATRTGAAVRLAGVPLGLGDAPRPVAVAVQPVSLPDVKALLFLVTMRDETEEVRHPPAAGDLSLFRHLEATLQTTRALLLTVVGWLNDSTEDLAAAREALQSTRQEFYCASEEREALSGDLRAANLRLEDKVAELEAMNVDLAALLDGTDVGTVFVDTALCLRRLNPAAARLLGLTHADIGRPLPDDAPSQAAAGLTADLAPVLADLLPREADVCAADGQWFIRRTTPYRTALGDVAGVTVTFTDETARKEAAEQARLLAAVLMTIHDAFILHDFEGRILVWNRGAERLYGYTEAEARRSNTDIIIPAELRDESHTLWERLGRGKAVEQWETWRVTKEGRRVDVWVVATVVRDAAGAPVAIAKVDRDVSDIKRTERELAALQSQLMSDLSAMKRLHEFSTVLIHAGSVEELLEQAMAAAVELTSATRGVMHVMEPESDTFRLVTQRGFDRPFLELYGRVLASEFEKILPTHSRRFIVEDVRTHPGLRDAPAHRDAILGAGIRALQSTPLYARSGRLVGVLTTHYGRPHRPSDRELRLLDLLARQVADLLERTETEADLRRSQEALRRSNETLEQRVAARTAELRDQMELFRTILDTAITGIINFDGQGTLRLVNPSVERMFGYTTAEMIGKHVSQLIPGLSLSALSRLDADAPGNRTAREVRGVRKDGSDIPLALAANRVDHRDLYTGILLDLSRRKELEREVVRISTQEQHRIGQYLHDDCGQQLTALSVVMDGLVDTLQSSAPEQAKTARRMADGLRAVLRKVRHISHGLALSEVEPEALTLALEELAAQMNETPGIRCECRVDPRASACDSHTATHLYHITKEACTNALKHANCSDILIKIMCYDDVLTLVVEDDGVGIPERISKGLGLRIMRNRASVIGAQLNVERKQSGGTRVVCTKRLEPSRNSPVMDLAW